MSHYKQYPAYKKTELQWLEKIPSHWKIVQSRRLFSQRKDKATDNDQQLTASQKYGVLYQTDYMAIEGSRVVQVIKGADILKHVETNDFVISMRSFQGGIEWSGLRGSISSAYVMLIPSASVNAAYFKYLLKCDSYIQALQSTSDLIRDGQALRFDNFAQIDLPVVPYNEQQAIAAHIERETIRIDALVSKKTRFIELLREKRQALITHAVTKGLDPNVKMKDSGVEWMGDVPDNWDVKRLRFVAIPKNSNVDKKVYEGQLETKLCNYTDVYYNETITPNLDFMQSTASVSEIEAFSLFAGDVIITKDSETADDIGIPAYVPQNLPGVVCGYHLTIIRSHGVEGEFLFRLLQAQSTKAYFFVEVSGITRFGLGQDTINNIVVPIPSQEEQQLLCRWISQETTRIDTLISKTERSIELLKERRSALITAAVTGQIDVRETV